ncbi:MAG: enoyl-CoA hydratase/isomerase family protein [Bryobacteraceae bacterium]
MSDIDYSKRGGIATVAMARGKANALNRAMVSELDRALDSAAGDLEVRAVIFTSHRPNFFSAGFDAREVFEYDRETMGRFLASYGALTHKLHHLPKPVIASIPGHTFAGGAILALACDFRIMAQGEFGFALNEINVGVVLPPGVFSLLADVVGNGHARRMVLTGESATAARALEIGLVDEVTSLEELRSRTLALARALAGKPGPTYAGIKSSIRKACGGGPLTPDVEPWFTPEAEEKKRALLAALQK